MIYCPKRIEAEKAKLRQENCDQTIEIHNEFEAALLRESKNQIHRSDN